MVRGGAEAKAIPSQTKSGLVELWPGAGTEPGHRKGHLTASERVRLDRLHAWDVLRWLDHLAITSLHYRSTALCKIHLRTSSRGNWTYKRTQTNWV